MIGVLIFGGGIYLYKRNNDIRNQEYMHARVLQMAVRRKLSTRRVEN